MPYKTQLPITSLLIRFFVVYLLLVFVGKTPAYSQQLSFPFHKEIKFSSYLINKEAFKDAAIILHRIDTLNLNVKEKDSLFYEIGWLAYTQKQLDTAANYLSKVSLNDVRHNKALFFGAYCYAFQKKYHQSLKLLNDTIFTKDSLLDELKNFELAGQSLLQRNYQSYTAHSKFFTYQSYMLQQEENKLNSISTGLKNYKKRSPFVAGLYSAIIPGSGKIYAGKKKQGIAAFFPVLASGLLAWEALNKSGIKSTRFILMGSVFGVFYIGNIWGSVAAVKIRDQEINNFYNNEILFNMHIPLRNFYN